MTYWKDQLSVFHRQKSVASSDGLTRIVVQLLTRIFRFLVPYLNWGQSGWERFKGSVNKNYYESNILGPLEEVKKFSEYLKREAGVQNSKHLARTEELAEIGLTLGGSMLAATKENSERLKNIERYLQTILAKRESKDRVAGLSDDEIVSLCQSFAGKMYVGDCGKGMLMANFEEATYRQRMGAASKSSPKVFESDDVIEADQQGTTTNELTFTELELRSRSLGVATTGFLGDTTQGPQQTSGKVFLSLATVGLGVSESQIAYVVSWPYC